MMRKTSSEEDSGMEPTRWTGCLGEGEDILTVAFERKHKRRRYEAGPFDFKY